MLPEPISPYTKETPPPFDILYQDAWILAVNKRAYVPVEPSMPGRRSVADAGKIGFLLYSEAGHPSPPQEVPESLFQQVQRWLESQLKELDSGGSVSTEGPVKRAKAVHPYLGLVHRIDQPVTGIVLFARAPEVLEALNRQFRKRQVYKLYWAITKAKPAEDAGTLEHYLVFDPKKNKSRILAPSGAFILSSHPQRKSRAKKALLHYRVVAS